MYLRVSPDLTDNAVAQKISDKTSDILFYGLEAAWIGLNFGNIGANGSD